MHIYALHILAAFQSMLDNYLFYTKYDRRHNFADDIEAY